MEVYSVYRHGIFWGVFKERTFVDVLRRVKSTFPGTSLFKLVLVYRGTQ